MMCDGFLGRMPLNELLKKLRSGSASIAGLSGEEGSGVETESSQSSSRRRNRKSQPSSNDNGECSSDALKLNSVSHDFFRFWFFYLFSFHTISLYDNPWVL